MVDVNDSLTSYVAGLGRHDRDKAATAHYQPSYINDFELINAYNTSWIAKKIVDIPAADALKAGRNWQADGSDISAIEREEERLGLDAKLLEAVISARLLGWSAIYIATGDEDVSQPINLNLIGRGGLQFLTVLSKRDIIPGDIDTDPMSHNYGMPAYYQVTGSKDIVNIHPSRIAIFVGEKKPAGTSVGLATSQLGISSLQSCFGAIKNADSTTSNIASLVFESNVDVFGVPDLMASFADPDYHRRLIDRFSLAATAKGINRALIRDKDEEYERKQISFGGLDSVLEKMLDQVCGAADIPATRLLGRSPGGLSSAGDSDMNNYYDKVRAIQVNIIGSTLDKIDQVMIRSALGNYPDDLFYTWPPLEVANEKERAEIGKLNADTAAVLVNTGLFLPEELRVAVSNQLIESAFYPGLEAAMDDDYEVDIPEFDVEKVVEPTLTRGGIRGESLQSTALNGAQIKSMLEVVMSLVEQNIPAETAAIVLQNGFPSVSQEDIRRLINSVKGFTPRRDMTNGEAERDS